MSSKNKVYYNTFYLWKNSNIASKAITTKFTESCKGEAGQIVAALAKN